MTDAPLLTTWTGTALVPAGRYWQQHADNQLVVGQRYFVEVRHERSTASHNHFFAALTDLWLSLPEHMTERFPTVEALRKFALIRTGYRDERSIVCSSKAEARRLAAFIRPMDDFAIVSVSEAVVVVQTAKSQAFKAMGREVFNRSKNDVLGYVSEMIGVNTGKLQRSA